MLQKRSLSLSGHRTSIALEPEFWDALQRLAEAETILLVTLIARIDAHRAPGQNLASALRVHVLKSLEKS
jgi:predicted DNA-binding ribbon-helix-helix protein